MMQGLLHLQRMGVSHRDISLENVLIDQLSNLVIIDFGMCLRLPFGANDGSIVDVTKGTLRRLMSFQGQMWQAQLHVTGSCAEHGTF